MKDAKSKSEKLKDSSMNCLAPPNKKTQRSKMQTLNELKQAAGVIGMPIEDFIKRKIALKHQAKKLLADEIERLQRDIEELMWMLDAPPSHGDCISAVGK